MPCIQMTGITRVYRSESLAVKALRGVDLTVDHGEFVAVMGPSGSGKSTLMNLLGCLDRPSSGSYLLEGEDVADASRDRLAEIRSRTLGFVFQNFHLLPRTSAVENVELPLIYSAEDLGWGEIHRRALETLTALGLGDRAGHTPAELSGGQQQRVAIARALVTKPSVLLADEPTGNLDSRTSLEIMDVLQALNRDGLTVLMVTHEPDMAAFASRTIILRDGLIRADRRHTPRSAADALAAEPPVDEQLEAEVGT